MKDTTVILITLIICITVCLIVDMITTCYREKLKASNVKVYTVGRTHDCKSNDDMIPSTPTGGSNVDSIV